MINETKKEENTNWCSTKCFGFSLLFLYLKPICTVDYAILQVYCMCKRGQIQSWSQSVRLYNIMHIMHILSDESLVNGNTMI